MHVPPPLGPSLHDAPSDDEYVSTRGRIDDWEHVRYGSRRVSPPRTHTHQEENPYPHTSSLCMLYKIFHNPEHPLHSELPNLFQPVRMTRNVANSHSLSFCPVRCNTVQYSRSFIPAFVKSWNDLPEEVVECSELQRFKTGANRFLLNLQV